MKILGNDLHGSDPVIPYPLSVILETYLEKRKSII